MAPFDEPLLDAELLLEPELLAEPLEEPEDPVLVPPLAPEPPPELEPELVLPLEVLPPLLPLDGEPPLASSLRPRLRAPEDPDVPPEASTAAS